MFVLAILLGIYAYGFFFLGVFHTLYPGFMLFWTGVIICLGILLLRKQLLQIRITFPEDTLSRLSLLLLFLLAGINFIGALGPELSFDALWYHLTFPKLYIQQQSISYIPGGLLYYSLMPKLGEMLYIPILFFSNETAVKVVHYLFGIFITIAIYKVARRYFSVSFSLLASLVFYSNIVVAWESTIAYIDLIRTFYEVMALWAFLLWNETKKNTWLYLSALLLGLEVTAKVLALESLLIFISLTTVVSWYNKSNIWNTCINIIIYTCIVLLVPLPWFIFSFIHTGNPVYPFFSSVYPLHAAVNNSFPQDFVTLFLFLDDPISPIYLLVLPLVLLYFSKFTFPSRLLGYYALIAVVLWYLTPRTGGGRFILPYLPVWSLLVIATLDYVKKQRFMYQTILFSIFFVALVTIVYRGIANSRYLPVILGKESKEVFLTKNLNFSFGDFYDTDGYFKNHIKASDKVLLYGFHNLYYITFPFIDISWVKKGDRFNYIATQNTKLPSQFENWQFVYQNSKTSVKLYKLTKEHIWEY